MGPVACELLVTDVWDLIPDRDGTQPPAPRSSES